MTIHPDDKTRVNWIAAGTAIGLVGGLAEVLVVGTYSRVAGVDAAAVAGAIATAVRVDPGSAIAGLVVHMALSAALGVALLAAAKGSGVLRAASTPLAYAWALLALGAIWSLNFLVVLPVISPGFVHLLPYPVTLASKLMFAAAAMATFRSIPGGATSRWLLPRASAPATA
jgi:hypothetical protein